MWVFIRWLLGLCQHHYELYRVEDVPYQGDEGNFIHIDLAKEKAIKYRMYVSICTHCGKLKTNKVSLK